MRIPPSALAKQINAAVTTLAQDECLFDYQSAVVLAKKASRVLVTWPEATDVRRSHAQHFTFADYISEVEQRQYTALFRNGAFMQMTYELDRDAVVGHRLVYVPSPIEIVSEELAVATLPELCRAVEVTKIRCTGPWRFDFDPDNAGVRHPPSHLTVNHSECRIPVAYPLSVRRFLDVVLDHLHDDVTPSRPAVGATTTSRCLDCDVPSGTWYFDCQS